MSISSFSPISPVCPSCSAGVDPDIAVFCDGCEKPMHFSCLGLLPDEIAVVSRAHKRSGHLKLLCADCNSQLKIALYHHYLDSNCIAESVAEVVKCTITSESESLKNVIATLRTDLETVKKNNADLMNMISSTVNIRDEIQSLRSEIDNLKCSNIDLIRLVTNDNKSVNFEEGTYSQKVQNNPVSSVIIKPKNTAQSIQQTKADVLESIKPLSSNIKINKVKTVSNGGVVINCLNKSESDKLANLADDKLRQNYSIRKSTPVLPRVRIVGIPEGLDHTEVSNYAITQNSGIFKKDSIVQVHKCWETSRGTKTLQAECTVDLESYKKLLDVGHILVGLNGCTVYDGVSVKRCFRCNGFNHGSKQCRKQLSCPLCSGPHELKNCTLSKDSKDLRCSNCVHLRGTYKFDIQVDHAVWDFNKCFAHKFAVAKLKEDLFNIPSAVSPNKLSETTTSGNSA